ncbi:MAG: hypothetical protein ABR878_04060 [Roseiarcus sp.]
MTMRKYRQLRGAPEDAANWVKERLAPILEGAGGFKAYYAVVFDDGTIGSINVFENEAAANEADKRVKERLGSSGSDMLRHVETKVWRVLYEAHP